MMINQDGVWAENADGTWSQSIPLPYYLWFGRVRCDCGKKFWKIEQYKQHYWLEHTDRLKYQRTPDGMVPLT